jgi:hypothetical protein
MVVLEHHAMVDYNIAEWADPRIEWLRSYIGSDAGYFKTKEWNRTNMIGSKNGVVRGFGNGLEFHGFDLTVHGIMQLLDIDSEYRIRDATQWSPPKRLILKEVKWDDNDVFSYRMLRFNTDSPERLDSRFYGDFIARLTIRDDAVAVMMKLALS